MERGNSRASARGIANNNNYNNRKKNENNIKVISAGGCHKLLECLETIFGVKILNFFEADPGSGMGQIRIRDPGWKKLGSGINIPDPQYWYQGNERTIPVPLISLCSTCQREKV